MPTQTKCFTFYSYKGGSGRSTTAVNTVRHLIDTMNASPEHPILIIDADLESAGLTYFFQCQNAFTHLFMESIHTTKIFNQASSSLDEVGANILFSGCGSSRETDVNQRWLLSSDLTLITKMAVWAPEGTKFEDVMAGVWLERNELSILKEIVNACYEARFNGQVDDIAYRYEDDLMILAEALSRTHRDPTLSLKEKTTQKIRAIRKLLPATRFADVSSSFHCEEGTVRFLGADVRFKGEQTTRNESTKMAIKRLIRMCEKKNYAAIIFDSGAGTQSSAEAFHKTSDILVYCMRPTRQFRYGTEMQLMNHKKILEKLREDKLNKGRNREYKPVILLPTAVPRAEAYNSVSPEIEKLCREAFLEIQDDARLHDTVVNADFCTRENALPEVELFKWEERILLDRDQLNEPDQKQAFDTYRRLAEKMTELVSDTEEAE